MAYIHVLSKGVQATIVAILLGLSSCSSTPTPYGPAAAQKGYGYADQQIEQNRYRVTFEANSATPRTRVEDYVLYHAAELTNAKGFDYFLLAAQNTEAMVPSPSSSPSFSIGGFGFGGGGGSGVGGGAGISFGAGDSREQYRASADVVMMKGSKPEGDARAFSAREVVGRLGPIRLRPGSGSNASER